MGYNKNWTEIMRDRKDGKVSEYLNKLGLQTYTNIRKLPEKIRRGASNRESLSSVVIFHKSCKNITPLGIDSVAGIRETIAKFWKLWPEVIEYLEYKFEEQAKVFNAKDFTSFFHGLSQETQERTIIAQLLFSISIAYVAKKNNFPMELKTVDGSDWVILVNGVEILIEQKVRTILKSEKKDLPITFTGTSHAGKKADIHFFVALELEGNKVYRQLVSFVSFEESKSQWSEDIKKEECLLEGKPYKPSSGYSSFTLAADTTGQGIELLSGKITKKTKKYYFYFEDV